MRDSKGNTLLLIAAQNGLRRMCKLILREGGDIDATNSNGNTALHFAFMYGFGDSLGKVSSACVFMSMKTFAVTTTSCAFLASD